MYGWINGCLEFLVISAHGLQVWETIKSVAGCDVQHGDFHRNVHYPDAMTYSLVSAAASVLKLTSDEVLETVGRQFLHFLKEHGYESTMRFQGNTFHQWIKNVNEPHRLLRSRFPKSRLPEFWSEEDESDPSKQAVSPHPSSHIILRSCFFNTPFLIRYYFIIIRLVGAG